MTPSNNGNSSEARPKADGFLGLRFKHERGPRGQIDKTLAIETRIEVFEDPDQPGVMRARSYENREVMYERPEEEKTHTPGPLVPGVEAGLKNFRARQWQQKFRPCCKEASKRTPNETEGEAKEDERECESRSLGLAS